LTRLDPAAQTAIVERARRHHVLLARLALGISALVAELAGRALTTRIDVGRHVTFGGNHQADYYPALLAGVKVAVALMLARVAWRAAKAYAAERAARRLLAARGVTPSRRAPRVRLELSPRLWLGAFLVTSSIYLVQMDAEGIADGRWPLLAPWLHTSALPVFAVLAVVVALVYGAVGRWLSDYEDYARAAVADARRVAARAPLSTPHPRAASSPAPRALFGLDFESRPPPAPA
jgi:hypothetical protein